MTKIPLVVSFIYRIRRIKVKELALANTLSDSNLSRSNMYNVLHMSVRPVSLAGVANSPTAKSRSSLLAAADAIRPRRQNIVDNDRVAHPVTVSTSSAVDNSHSYGTAPGAEARNAGCGCVII